MIRTLYIKNQYFFHLLVFNILWSTIRIFQWLEIQPERLTFILRYVGVEVVVAVVFCKLMVLAYKQIGMQKNILLHIALFVGFLVLFPAFMFTVSYSVKYVIWPEGILYELTFRQIKSSFYFYITFFIGLIGLIYMTRFRLNFITQKEATLKAESLAKETQLKMLRYQINPHFLFNILNSLHALVDENRETARKLIIDISEYYRFTLEKQIQKHSIGNEMNIIRKYLEIQKIRFEDKFEYEIMADEKAKAILIPSFIIHLLVENAIKYGFMTIDKKLVVKLMVTLTKKNLSVSVMNTGKLAPVNKDKGSPNEGTGSGIDNINKRLELLFDDDFTFTLKEENNWVIAKIEIDSNRL
jgi:two-component system, LytTR family, sensor kinase